MKGQPEPLLEDKQWVADLAFLVDVTKLLADLNVSLQGKNKLIGDLWDRIRAFKVELSLYELELREGNLENFPSLLATDVSNCNFDEYVQALNKLRNEFNDRFTVIQKMEPELNVFMTPFSVPIEKAPDNLKVELIRFQHNSILKDRYYHFNGDLVSFYKGVKQQDFPKLHALALKFLSMFGTSYVCELLFSFMKLTKSKHRATMCDSTLQSLLRIQTSKTIQPNLSKIVQAKQGHPSH